MWRSSLPNSEATAASGRSQHGDFAGFQHLQQAELGGCGECACGKSTGRGGEAGPTAGGHSRGCGAAEGIPGRSQRRGLARLEREAGGRPSCGLGRRGLSLGSGTSPLSFCAPYTFFMLVFSPASCQKSGQRSPLRLGPCWTSGSCPALFRTLAPLPFSSPVLTSVAEMAGSSEPGPQPDFPFSPGLSHSVPDVSRRKPVYPNGE